MHKVWVADDDSAIRIVLEESLSSAGFETKTFATGDDLVNQLDIEQPDLILTDVQMPGMLGYDLLKHIINNFENLPVIVMTAFTDMQAAVDSYGGGAFEYIPKPFDLDEAIQIIKNKMKDWKNKMKNIIAIGCGIIDKMQLGDNAKSAFISRGLREIVRFGTSFKAKEYTFYGLSGIGDLIATCVSNFSRNWQLGYALASGDTLESFIKKNKVTLEGANASKIVNRVATEKKLEMPITLMTNKVVHENYDPVDAIKEFMGRNPSKERN